MRFLDKNKEWYSQVERAIAEAIAMTNLTNIFDLLSIAGQDHEC